MAVNENKGLEQYFDNFRKNIVGIDTFFKSPYGRKKIIYGDWIASGRLYGPIEDKIRGTFGPMVGNTHTETTVTGTSMTKAYQIAHQRIKKHVHAGPDDVIITAGFGMTVVINKLQRILGFKGCGSLIKSRCLKEVEKPVVFITHMEHHSNHTSWLTTNAEVVIIKPDKNLLVDLDDLRAKLKQYKNRKFKIGSFTACSNVTGIRTPYHEMARIMHESGGLCFVDFAASAPYSAINMHPKDPMEKLDAIFFSPHKFLGGPGSSGVLIFDSSLYNRKIPDHPGGGTVDWTNPWGKYKFIDDIELREDGGTPGFLQAIRTSLCLELKEKMGTKNIEKREKQLVEFAFNEFDNIPQIRVLADNIRDRLGVISFYLEDLHYNLFVKLLNDRFGIQTRGGCACAGTYGHYLLDVSYEHSKRITDRINFGDFSEKPGWVRLSLHPTMTNEELLFIMDAIRETVKKWKTWSKDYSYNKKTNEFVHRNFTSGDLHEIQQWFKL